MTSSADVSVMWPLKCQGYRGFLDLEHQWRYAWLHSIDFKGMRIFATKENSYWGYAILTVDLAVGSSILFEAALPFTPEKIGQVSIKLAIVEYISSHVSWVKTAAPPNPGNFCSGQPIYNSTDYRQNVWWRENRRGRRQESKTRVKTRDFTARGINKLYVIQVNERFQ